MGLAPFVKKQTPADYAAPSGPNSTGRMPKQHSTPSLTSDSGPDATATMPAPPVDGGVVVHDRNYPREAPQTS